MSDKLRQLPPVSRTVAEKTGMALSKVQRLIDKINGGQPAIGVLNMSYSVELVEILAHAGFDFIHARSRHRHDLPAIA